MDGSLETDIDGATSSTYTLADDDVGSQIKVAVSFTDDRGNPEERTSAAFPANLTVLAKAECNLPPHHRSFGFELLAATMTVGSGSNGEFGFDRGVGFGDLSVRTFQRPDGNPDDWLAAPTNEQSIVGVYEAGPSVVIAVSPGWGRPGLFGGPALRVCDDTIGFWFSNFASDDDVAFYAVNHDADWSAFATREVRLYEDRAPPEIEFARIHGRALDIKFTEELLNTQPSLDSFDVRVSGRLAGVNSASINGRTISLALASAVAESASVTVDYNGGPDNTFSGIIADKLRNRMGAFRQNVRVAVPPKLQSSVLAADGAALTLTFDEDLDGASVPPAGAFTVRVGGARRALAPVNPVSVSGRTVVLRLAKPAGAGEAVTVAYEKPNPN